MKDEDKAQFRELCAIMMHANRLNARDVDSHLIAEQAVKDARALFEKLEKDGLGCNRLLDRCPIQRR